MELLSTLTPAPIFGPIRLRSAHAADLPDFLFCERTEACYAKIKHRLNTRNTFCAPNSICEFLGPQIQLRRQLLPTISVVTLLSAVIGFAYFSQNPTSPILEAAQKWPLVGQDHAAAERGCDTYLGPATSDVAKTLMQIGLVLGSRKR